MSRIFNELIGGRPPQLVDLPTGSGKTDLIVVWLLALAWYAQDRVHRAPIPRRMVWVINRRVLVQQVFDLADSLQRKLAPDGKELNHLRCALRSLCRDSSGECLRIVQLRGQLVDDREWSFDPSVPQLVIGTVDQIGSRLLFQGYGLGKWSRPLHAALLGVDAWVCIDEAHLVPAFALTLRQISEHASKPLDDTAEKPLGEVFRRCPFWTTELSATPALPRPSADKVLTITEEDREDGVIADRLLAAQMRQVHFQWLADPKKLADELVNQATLASIGGASVAIFCRTVATAEKVSQMLGKRSGFKGRVLTVTGRLRGYERDRLKEHSVFARFRRDAAVDAGSLEQPAFLVGTAAAEVGLDADADAIVCDFAPLPTLLQRLGRLDRRGSISKRAKEKGSPPPKMTIVAAKPTDPAGKEVLGTLAKNLNESVTAAALYAGTAWRAAAKKPGVNTMVEAATWAVVCPEPESATASPPSSWLSHRLARVAPGPVVVPPLTSAVLRHWAATTPHPSRFLPVHPWLYGLLPDDEGTPLVGIAFRLELDLLQHEPPPDDEAQAPELAPRVLEALGRFPPLRTELHLVPLEAARKWLTSLTNRELKIAHYDGDVWAMFEDATLLRPDALLVLPTSTDPIFLGNLLVGISDLETARSDVFGYVSHGAAHYRREVQVTGSSSEASFVQSDLGVYRVAISQDGLPQTPNDADFGNNEGWDSERLQLVSDVKGLSVKLTYLRRAAPSTFSQLLKDHHTGAEQSARKLAKAIAPGSDFVERLLTHASADHDRGKAHGKWQRAMGNPNPDNPIAKPLVEQPASTNGYRHEWGSLLEMDKLSPSLPDDWDEATRQLWLDLWRHLVAAHHGYFRPSMPDRGFANPPTPSKQSPMRLQAVERYARLQQALGPWRLAYLESLLKGADVEASREAVDYHPDED